MDDFKAAALKGYQDALEAYKADIDQLAEMEKRLIAQHNDKRAKLKNFKSAAKGKELLAECGTIGVQIEKVQASALEAEKRFQAKVDAADASIIEKFKGLAAYAVGTGNVSAGVRYLYDECLSYDKAKGNLEARKACFSSVCNIVAAITGAEDDSAKKGIAQDQLDIYEQFEQMEEGEGKTTFFQEHKQVIGAVYDVLRLA